MLFINIKVLTDYMFQEKGENGMINIKDYWQRMYLSTLGYILKSKTVQGRAIKNYYMQKKGRNYIAARGEYY